MKVYKATLYNVDMGAMLQWFSNKREADKAVREHVAQLDSDPVGPCDVQTVEIATDRAGLLRWLNTHFTTNNG